MEQGARLRVTFPDRTSWDIPLDTVARCRAKYFAERDSERGYGDYTEVYEAEMEASNSELVEWASNNMDWSDVEAVAVRVDVPVEQPKYAAWWTNAHKEVV